MKEASRNTRGFTLLEILLVIGIMGVIAIFTIGISHSIRSMTKTNDTKGRMEQIAAKAREFYRAHESLPAPGTTPANSVPVGASDLNMEQKFRLDAWGQYLRYDRVENSGNIVFHGQATLSLAAGDATYIRGVQVNGRRVAGVIISNGPNQAPNYTVTTGQGSNPKQYTAYALISGSDDIMIPIDVSQEALEIASEELKVLQSKVKAFDAIYEGIDNDGVGGTDESLCIAQTLSAGCPPNGTSSNDPNCGLATLDAVYLQPGSPYSGCTAGNCGFQWTAVTNTLQTGDRVNAFIYCLYALADTLIYDPWLNVYKWGDSPIHATNDPRYHKFFSLGPNETTTIDPIDPVSVDDIIP